MLAPLTRLIIALWAVAVAAMPGALAIADARFEAAARSTAPSHVEALGGTDCAPVHDAECGVCSSLRLLAGAIGEAGVPGSPAAELGATSCPGRATFASSIDWTERQPRAPPSA